MATATFTDTYFGPLKAELKPYKTTRNGLRVTLYRWIDERGCCCDGLRTGHSLERMIAHAKRNRFFSGVVA